MWTGELKGMYGKGYVAKTTATSVAAILRVIDTSTGPLYEGPEQKFMPLYRTISKVIFPA